MLIVAPLHDCIIMNKRYIYIICSHILAIYYVKYVYSLLLMVYIIIINWECAY